MQPATVWCHHLDLEKKDRLHLRQLELVVLSYANLLPTRHNLYYRWSQQKAVRLVKTPLLERSSHRLLNAGLYSCSEAFLHSLTRTSLELGV
jgi:hypothetical protein